MSELTCLSTPAECALRNAHKQVQNSPQSYQRAALQTAGGTYTGTCVQTDSIILLVVLTGFHLNTNKVAEHSSCAT